jgi:hypothetical protein
MPLSFSSTKNFRKTHITIFGFMIKCLEAIATGNEFATPLSASSQRQKEKTSKTTFSTFKHDENPHGVPDGPDFDAGIFEISRGCLQVVEPPTLLFNQFVAPMIKHQKPFSQPLKWYEKPHGVLGNPGLDADVCECEQRCLQVDQPPTLLFNQFAAFTAPNSKSMAHFKETIGLQFYVLTYALRAPLIIY